MKLTSGGRFLHLRATSWGQLTPGQRHLLAGKVWPLATLVTISG